MSNGRLKENAVVENPQSPVEAFESFVALVRNSPMFFEADPDLLYRHLAPFLANTGRDQPYVREIVEAIVATRSNGVLRATGLGPIMKLVGRLRTIEKAIPHFMRRLEQLEASLKTDLQPGSVSVHVRPAQFIERAKGYGPLSPCRYRIQIQTLVETSDDELQALSVEVGVGTASEQVEIDDLEPKSAFSSVSRKSAATSQTGMKRTESSGQTIGGGLGGPASKLNLSVQSAESFEQSMSFSDTAEQTLSRVEHYLVARKIANRAWWHVLAGIGPIDAAAGEYSIDCLVPEGVQEIDVMIEARVDWLRAGIVPARITQRMALPPPDTHSDPPRPI
jgi:hypothetical protein